MNYYRGTVQSRLDGMYFTTSYRVATGYALLVHFMHRCLIDDEPSEPAVVGSFLPRAPLKEDPCGIPGMYISAGAELLETEILSVPNIPHIPKFLLIISVCGRWADGTHEKNIGVDCRRTQSAELTYIFCQCADARMPVLYQYKESALGRKFNDLMEEMVELVEESVD